jgi:hypothetical protein
VYFYVTLQELRELEDSLPPTELCWSAGAAISSKFKCQQGPGSKPRLQQQLAAAASSFVMTAQQQQQQRTGAVGLASSSGFAAFTGEQQLVCSSSAVSAAPTAAQQHISAHVQLPAFAGVSGSPPLNATAAAAAATDVSRQQLLQLLSQQMIQQGRPPPDTSAAAAAAAAAAVTAGVNVTSQPLLLLTQHMMPGAMLAQPSAAAAAAAAAMNISSQPMMMLNQQMQPQAMYVSTPAAAAVTAEVTAGMDMTHQPLLTMTQHMLPQLTVGHNAAYPLSSVGMPLQLLPVSDGVAVAGAPVVTGLADAVSSSSSGMPVLPGATDDLKHQLQQLQLKQQVMNQQPAGMYELHNSGYLMPAAAADVGFMSSGPGASLAADMTAAAAAAGQMSATPLPMMQHIATGHTVFPDTAACQLVAGQHWLSTPPGVLSGTGVARGSAVITSGSSTEACGVQRLGLAGVQHYSASAGASGAADNAAVTAAGWQHFNSW